jgi:hypothetical protein
MRRNRCLRVVSVGESKMGMPLIDHISVAESVHFGCTNVQCKLWLGGIGIFRIRKTEFKAEIKFCQLSSLGNKISQGFAMNSDKICKELTTKKETS